MVEEFGDGGFAPTEVAVTEYPNRVAYYDGKLYLAWSARTVDPVHSDVLVLDPQTGALLNRYDMPYYVSEGGSYGPHGLWVDASGIYTVGMGSPYVVHEDLDGNIVWVNGNGDGFNDKKDDAGVYYAGNYSPANYSYTIQVDKYGFAYTPNGGSEFIGAVYGPDGTVIFGIDPKKNQVMWPKYVQVIDDDGPYDGLMWDTGHWDHLPFGWPVKILHIPFDNKMGTILAVTAVEAVEAGTTPGAFALGQAYPNPFNPSTSIQFDLAERAYTTVKVYSATGQLINTLASHTLDAGAYRVTWDARDADGREVSAGTYLYTLTAGNFSETKKVVLLK
jgi:hypothetical protein